MHARSSMLHWTICFSLLLCLHPVSASHDEQLRSSSGATSSATQAADPTSSTTLGSTTLRASSNTSHAVSSHLPISICQSRTVNWITHTLPQQCLGTSLPRSERVSRDPWGEDGAQSLAVATTDGGNSSSIHNATSGSPTTTSAVATDSTATAAQTPHIAEAVDSATPVPEADSLRYAGDDNVKDTLSGTVTSTSATPGTTVSSVTESEADSPFDNANFLSFEEWKKQNLAKSGQSPENMGRGRGDGLGSREGRRNRPGSINNALDSLGEDGEIELDFGGFGDMDDGTAVADKRPTSTRQEKNAQPSAEGEAAQKGAVPTGGSVHRSKDAGKTCKERFNYASFDCAATVLKTNKETKSASSVLVENKDSYMLNPCSVSNKFFIVELCEDILVDTVVLANFEFFSSMFRTFRVSVSDRYPVKLDRWKELGTFEARNAREVQAFLVEHPLIYARYVRVELLNHFGNEYYCPISLFRVHGTTMMEEFRHQEEAARGETDDDEELEPEAAIVTGALPHDATVAADDEATFKPEPTVVAGSKPTDPVEEIDGQLSDASAGNNQSTSDKAATDNDPQEHSSSHLLASRAILEHLQNSTSARVCRTAVQSAPGRSHLLSTDQSQPALIPEPTEMTSSPFSDPGETTRVANASTSSIVQQEANITTSAKPTSSATQASTPSPSKLPGAAQPAAGGKATHSASTPHDQSHRPPPSSTAPALPNPTTQESFFKSIHKRLQMLESNSTLSLQYIEEQSRILRDAFTKVERRQINKTETFLTGLNESLMAELRAVRQQYSHLYQSTVLELEQNRLESQHEIMAMSQRLTILADELVLQKRMMIAQSFLLLLSLGLVLFSRSTAGPYFEFPKEIMQGMVPKRWASPSPPDSPPPKFRRSWRTKRGLRPENGHVSHQSLSDDNPEPDSASLERRAASASPSFELSPPTPVSEGELTEGMAGSPEQLSS